jgi:hypothetical protein
MGNSDQYYSTVINPIRFFQYFFSSDKFINEEREYFFPNPDDLEDPAIIFTNNKVSNIDLVAESYDLEYETDFEWHLDTTKESYPILVIERNVWHKKKIFFGDKLGITLFEQVETSIELIKENISQSINEEANKSNVANWLTQMQQFLTKVKSQLNYSKYPACSDSVNKLIDFISDKYSFLLSTKISSVRKSLPPSKKSLNIAFYSSLIELRDKEGNLLLENMKKARGCLLNLVEGNFENIQQMNFLWGNETVYYLLGRIRFYTQPRFIIKDLAKCSQITIKGKSFKASSFYKGNIEFKKNNSKLRNQIDYLISINIVDEMQA